MGRLEGSEEDWCVCNSRAVSHQDPGEASHQGRSEEHLRQGCEGCGKASQDDCEGLPGSSIEEADLEQRSVTALLSLFRGLLAVGIPWCRLDMGSVWPWQLQFVHASSCHLALDSFHRSVGLL